MARKKISEFVRESSRISRTEYCGRDMRQLGAGAVNVIHLDKEAIDHVARRIGDCEARDA
jgi:hypothetical protein